MRRKILWIVSCFVISNDFERYFEIYFNRIFVGG